MKKVFGVVIFTLLLFIAGYMLFNVGLIIKIPSAELEKVVIYKDGKVFDEIESTEAVKYVDLLNNAKGGIKNNIDTDYSVKFILKSGKTREYHLQLDSKSFSGYIPVHWFYALELREKDVRNIFSTGMLWQNYKENAIRYPEINIKNNNDAIPIQSHVLEWFTQMPSGEYDIVTNPIDIDSLMFSAPEKEISTSEQYRLEVLCHNFRKPDAQILRVYEDEKLISESDEFNIYIPDEEKSIYYEVELEWIDEKEFRSFGKIIYSFDIKVDLPAEVVVADSIAIRPADVVTVIVKNADEDEEFDITASFNTSGEFFRYNNLWAAVLPVDWWSQPGEYSITVTDSNGNVVKKIPINILKNDFETTNQQLIVSSSLAQKASKEATNHDAEYIRKAKSISNELPLFEGLFIWPVQGRISTTFARTRYINWENPYRHSGIDIAAVEGTSVKAANSGKVVLAMELIRTGTTVIIDHGAGMFSSYLHLSKIDVAVGDEIKKGDKIGEVGSTGFSTGPHLHWTITINGKYIDPEFLLENDILKR